jgi:hypothetical protein
MGKDVPIWTKCIEIITLIILFAGVVAGWNAYFEYKNANTAQMIYTLYEMDKETTKSLLEKPYLQAIFAQPPKNIDIKLSSIKLLQLFIIDTDSNNVCTNWRDVPDLYDILFEYDNFNDPTKMRLREGYCIAESILYTLLNAYSAKESKLISQEDYETYIGYCYEVGKNPLFLCAIFCAHKYNYITKSFAIELKHRLLIKADIKNVFNVIYSDLLKEDWLSRVGQGN